MRDFVIFPIALLIVAAWCNATLAQTPLPQTTYPSTNFQFLEQNLIRPPDPTAPTQNLQGVELFSDPIIRVERLALQGSAEAQYAAGIRYMMGRNTDVDLERAVKWFSMAADQGNKDAKFRLGKIFGLADKLYNQEQSFKYYLSASQSEHPEASWIVGELYLQGRGVEADDKKAFDSFQLAANLGVVQADVSIGDMYYHGYAPNSSPEKARHHYEKAARQGNTGAMLKVAELAVTDPDKPPNFIAAHKWLETAAKRDSANPFIKGNIARAQQKLGDLYVRGVEGIDADTTLAKSMYEMARKNGNVTASVKLGQILTMDGDFVRAESLFREAAELGDADGQAALGNFYFSGLGGQPDYPQAVPLLQLAANQLQADALLQLGKAHLSGREIRLAGGKPDALTGRQMIHTSAERGNKAAREIIPQVDYEVCHKYQGITCLPFPIFYVTDRRDTNGKNPYERFDNRLDANRSLHYGSVTVQIPISKENINEHLTFWKALWLGVKRSVFGGSKDSSKVKIIEIDPAPDVGGGEEFYSRLIGAAHGAKTFDGVPAILLFVHGFANSFSDAAQRAGKLADDLKFVGVPMIYSWASANVVSVSRYRADERTVKTVCRNVVEVLREIVSRDSEVAVYIVAHSMGGRLVFNAMTFCERYPDRVFDSSVRQLVFAAPDIRQKTFRDYSEEIEQRADRVTIYASSKDLALRLGSELLESGLPRVGEGGPRRLVVSGIHTIDTSAIDADLTSHDFVFTYPTVTQDLHQMLRKDDDPNQRTCLVEDEQIVEDKDEPVPFWVLRRDC